MGSRTRIRSALAGGALIALIAVTVPLPSGTAAARNDVDGAGTGTVTPAPFLIVHKYDRPSPGLI